MVIVAAFIITRRVARDSQAVEVMAVLWSLCIPAIAAAFLIGLIRRRLMIARVLGRLSVRLNEPLERDELRPVLASALGDPDLDVVFWDEDRQAWPASATGRPGAVLTEVRDNRVPIAGIVHDAALAEDDELLDAVASQSLAALRHTQLNTHLEASRAQLEASRSRVNAAAEAERRRIERDLHDGAQQRLVDAAHPPHARRGAHAHQPGGRGARGPRRSGTRSTSRWRSCARSRTASTRPCSPTAASPTRCAARRGSRSCRSTSTRRA